MPTWRDFNGPDCSCLTSEAHIYCPVRRTVVLGGALVAEEEHLGHPARLTVAPRCPDCGHRLLTPEDLAYHDCAGEHDAIRDRAAQERSLGRLAAFREAQAADPEHCRRKVVSIIRTTTP